MKLVYYKGEKPNFGDDLNGWLWPKILPDFFDEDDDKLFLGFGSFLNNQYPPYVKKIVVGTAYVPQYFHETPNVHTADWQVSFVRGPRTAQMLGIPTELGIGDPAILLRTVIPYQNRTPEVISYMPHAFSRENGNWAKICDLAGVNFIDVYSPIEIVIKEILRSKVVIAEAMHGAIVADALRVPWIPMRPICNRSRLKWHDWAEAMQTALKPRWAFPANISEARSFTQYNPVAGKCLGALNRLFPDIVTNSLEHFMASRIRKIAHFPPSLSKDSVIDSAVSRMQERIDILQKLYR